MKNRLFFLLLNLFVANGLRADEFIMPSMPVGADKPLYAEPKKNPYGLQVWTKGYDCASDKTFMTLGVHTKPLSALIFNQDNFKISEAFASGMTAQMTENINTTLNSTRLFPRVSCSERGVVVGMQCEYPGPLKKSRVGVRVSVPFKTIRMERDDQASASIAGNQQDYVVGVISSVNVPTVTGGTSPTTVPTTDVVVETNMYKGSLLTNLPMIQGGQVISVFNTTTGGDVSIGGQAYTAADPGNGFGGIRATSNEPYVVFLWKDTQNAPLLANRAIKLRTPIQAKLVGALAVSNVFIETGTPTADDSFTQGISGVIMDSGKTTLAASVHNYSGALGTATAELKVAPLQKLPTAYASIQENTLYTFEAGKFADYQTLLQQYGDTLWFMTTNRASDGSPVNPSVDNFIQRRIAQYGSQSPDEWLWSSGYQFDTSQRTGLGDVNAELFYEYTFSPKWRGEIVLGVVVPTESAPNPGGHAYKPLLGSNGHYGIKVGSSLTWQPLDYMVTQADGSYTFTLEATEHRFAAFKGASIKNIGPVVDADVEFGTFDGRIAMTLYHPKTKVLSMTLGYDFKYKEEDDVQFKQKTYDFGANGGTWFGGLYNSATKSYGSNEQTLDNGVARMNTERISHKVSVETALKLYEYVQLSAGGSYTVMGQNAPQERGLFCSLKTWF